VGRAVDFVRANAARPPAPSHRATWRPPTPPRAGTPSSAHAHPPHSPATSRSAGADRSPCAGRASA
jgi:hypothetical protein